MMQDGSAIKEYLAHVYYEPGVTEAAARQVRGGVGAAFPRGPALSVARRAGCPHTRAMFQMALPVTLFPGLAPWLMLNRRGLDVLVHPESRDDPTDHRLGDKLPLRMEAFTR